MRGCEVILADRQIDMACEVESKIRSRGGMAMAVELDVRDLGGFERVVRDTLSHSRRIDFLFNNAGIGVGGEMESYEPEDFDDVFDVNLRGVAWGIQTVYPVMIKQGAGHIINTASIAGLIAAPGSGSYTATKHAVVGLSKALRIEAARHGVRVSTLCPGAIRTPNGSSGRFGRVKQVGATEHSITKLWEGTRAMTPEVFARRAIDRVLANDALIVLPRWWKAFWYLDRISPAASMAVWRRLHENVQSEHDDGVPSGARMRDGGFDKRVNGGQIHVN